MNEIIKTQHSEIAVQDFTNIAKKYLSAMGNKLSDAQQNQFIEICKAYGLNPFKREIYGVSYTDKNGQSTFNVIVGYEVYIKRAERSGKLNGWSVRVEGTGADMKAIVEIHRKDWENPFIHEVYLSEATTGKSQWAKQPRFMLKKVAIGQGFRLCFPDDLGGIPYLEEEILQEPMQEKSPAEKIGVPITFDLAKPENATFETNPTF